MKTTTHSPQRPIGIAIAGLGFGESVHLPAVQTSDGLNLLKFWHPRQARLEKACEEHGINGESDWSKLLTTPGLDAVIIATPPEPRFKLAQLALQAGKHLFLEKPVALNSREVSALQKLAITKGLSVAVDFEYRAVPLFIQAARLLGDGAVGKPWLVKFDWLMSSRANASRPWNWYSETEQGGGVIGALGTHAFDLLHWLIGPPRAITGRTSISIPERPHPNGSDLQKVSSEDVALAQIQLEDSHGDLVPAQVNLASVARNGRGCWIEIYGSQGTIILGSDNQKDYVHGFGLWHARAGEALRSVKPDPDLCFQTTWSDGRIAPVKRLLGWWADSINLGRPMIPGLSEGLMSQKVCDQLKESALSEQSLIIK